MIEPLAKLTHELSLLPGIGPKSAQRLAYHIVALSEAQVRDLAQAIFYAKKNTRACSVCGALTMEDPCALCTDPRRQNGVLCVVRDARDVAAMERMRDYAGQYHVLGGTISPMEGVGPDQIRLKELMERLASGQYREVILATNPDVEGEATAIYIAQQVKKSGIKVTRIAHGVPVGGNLEYTDAVTLSRAMEGRREM